MLAIKSCHISMRAVFKNCIGKVKVMMLKFLFYISIKLEGFGKISKRIFDFCTLLANNMALYVVKFLRNCYENSGKSMLVENNSTLFRNDKNVTNFFCAISST